MIDAACLALGVSLSQFETLLFVLLGHFSVPLIVSLGFESLLFGMQTVVGADFEISEELRITVLTWMSIRPTAVYRQVLAVAVQVADSESLSHCRCGWRRTWLRFLASCWP
mmetsp:Transcript_135094/g.431689  ORF Transcript_135094/g.431689 Transcript_135094/m.431689 type:complete len:111 (-) Transcript_135094:41-373(-)